MNGPDRPYSPCPHCGATARFEPSGAFRWRCGVCGGPVVPTPQTFPRSNAELASLVSAQRSRAMKLGWSAAALFIGAMAAMAAMVTVFVGIWSTTAALVPGLLAVVATALTVVFARRASKHRAASLAKVDEAWLVVAGDVLRSRGRGITAPELAKTMQVEEPYAEALLSRLSASGRARVDVDDDAELKYRVADESPARVEDAAGMDSDDAAEASLHAPPRGAS